MINLNIFIIKKKNKLHKVQINFLRDINSVLFSLFHTVEICYFLPFFYSPQISVSYIFDIIHMPDITLHVIHSLFQTVNISK